MSWHPDWSGRTVVLAATGPSLVQEALAAARGRAVVVAISDAWRLAPWADALYACDPPWWRISGPKPSEFAGLRIVGKRTFPGCIPANVMRGTGTMFWDRNRLGGGGNGGFQALNLAAVCGARRILLLGFDYQDAGQHFFGGHPEGLKVTTPREVEKWISAMERNAPELRRRGVEVINCSRATALTCFPRMPIGDAL